MLYADFPFYQDGYRGTMLTDATVYGTAAARASEYLDMVTFGRLLDGIPPEFELRVRKCVCALAEALYTFAAFGTGAEGAQGLKTSETIGAYSVGYANPAEWLSSLLDGDTAGLGSYLKSICMRYLGTTGLLFRGCC